MNNPAKGLSRQMLWGVALSLAAAVAVFAVCFGLGNLALRNTIYGKPFITQVEKRKMAELQEYLVRESVTAEHLHPLEVWCSQNGDLYLSVYCQGTLLYESEATGDDIDITLEDPQRGQVLALSDGMPVMAYLYYYAGDAVYYLMIVACVLVAMAAFTVCMIALVRRKVAYIQQLRRELDILAGGDMTYSMTVRGQDELSALAEGIDQMRRSVVTHTEAEQRMRSAGSELITAMSHDLRTPLTAQIGYLELLQRDRCANEDQRRYCVERSLQKAVQIKEMAEKLFSYALLYEKEGEIPDTETVPIQWLGRLLEEYASALEEAGFAAVTRPELPPGCLAVDVDLMRRLWDNLYANLLKYADPMQPVILTCAAEDGALRLTLTNESKPQAQEGGGTHIGLKTCRRIAEYHGGTFTTGETAEGFSVTLALPLSSSASPDKAEQGAS